MVINYSIDDYFFDVVLANRLVFFTLSFSIFTIATKLGCKTANFFSSYTISRKEVEITSVLTLPLYNTQMVL
jgi:hypothetical protein